MTVNESDKRFLRCFTVAFCGCMFALLLAIFLSGCAHIRAAGIAAESEVCIVPAYVKDKPAWMKIGWFISVGHCPPCRTAIATARTIVAGVTTRTLEAK